MTKILLADDDDLLLRMYQRVFSHAQYEIITAKNGKDALIKAKNFQPDILLTDVMMPEMTGLELFEEMKKDPQTATIKVVFLTNLNQKHLIEEMLAKGAAGYIIKDEHHPDNVLTLIKNMR